jgi:photosystem II stability/assembly factor-like uncharacterized protein
MAGGNPWSQGFSQNIAVDPTDANVLYAMCSFFGPQGLYKSTDGGDSWTFSLSADDVATMTVDIYSIVIDPRDHLHVLITFHSPWASLQDAGVAESLDGGKTWIKHAPESGWHASHYVFFLGQDDQGNPSSTAWILATQDAGFFRTMNAGQTWDPIAPGYFMQHGATALYRASTGDLYMGALQHLLRSTDNGKTWSDAGALSNSDGYNSVIGDGVRMFTAPANTGTSSDKTARPLYSSLESDGQHWEAYNDQTFLDGPGWMAADRCNRIIYASLWDHGFWRLRTGD